MGKIGLTPWRGLEQNVYDLAKGYFRTSGEARHEQQIEQCCDKPRHSGFLVSSTVVHEEDEVAEFENSIG